jgi:hypothetical protein
METKGKTMDHGESARVVMQYMAAWNEVDAVARQALLGQCWADDGIYVDPKVELAGREALAQHISGVKAERPGARLEFMSGIEIHHNVLRFLWRLVHADGTCGDTSIDVGEIGPDGRLIRIIGFFGPAPPKQN